MLWDRFETQTNNCRCKKPHLLITNYRFRVLVLAFVMCARFSEDSYCLSGIPWVVEKLPRQNHMGRSSAKRFSLLIWPSFLSVGSIFGICYARQRIWQKNVNSAHQISPKLLDSPEKNPGSQQMELGNDIKLPSTLETTARPAFYILRPRSREVRNQDTVPISQQ